MPQLPDKKPVVPFKAAPRALLYVLRALNFDAVTLPNGIAYFQPQHLNDRGLRWHELAHLRQLQRYGQSFWVRYYWQTLTVGYQRNLFEIEANAYREYRHIQ